MFNNTWNYINIYIFTYFHFDFKNTHLHFLYYFLKMLYNCFKNI